MKDRPYREYSEDYIRHLIGRYDKELIHHRALVRHHARKIIFFSPTDVKYHKRRWSENMNACRKCRNLLRLLGGELRYREANPEPFTTVGKTGYK